MMLAKNVGVAPGTTMVRWDPYTDMIELSGGLSLPQSRLSQIVRKFAAQRQREGVLKHEATTAMHGFGRPGDRPIRWDLIGVVGGGSLIVAMTAGLIANAFSRR